MATQMENAEHVKLILRSLTESIHPAERTIIFDNPRHRIPIGRASRSASKGLLAATDNAWFNSPVMSRKHAELFIDSENKAVMIQDTGALHGTRLNNALLRRDEATKLVDGDVLVFGAEVRRGSETFPACSFRINYGKDSSSPSMNTIKFPESSDIEDYDKDDDYTSGYDSDEAEETPLESPDHSYKKLSIVKETIDLTEDSDGSYIGPRGLSEDEICTDAAVINLEKLRSNPTFDKPCEISEDECIGGDKVESCEDGHSDGPCDSYVDITDSQYDSEDEGEDEDRQIPISFATENSTDNDLESRIKSHNQNGEMNTGYANEEVRLSHIRSNLDEIGYTSSPVEGKPSVVSNEDNVRNGSSGNTTKELAYDSDTGFPEVHFHEDSWAYPGISDTQRFSMDEINRKADNNAAFDSSSSAQANRAPEPSGSTIAENGKPMLASTSFHFATTHFMRDGDLEKITQKTLGDKTGKQVYFEAREKNRESILNAIDQSSSPQGFPFGDQNWYSHCEDIDQPSASVCLGGTSVQSEKAPLPSIDNKADVPDPLSNQISSTADASTQKSYNEPQSSFPVQVPSPSKPTKRKADAISTIQDDEIRAWAESNDGLSNTSADVPIQSHVPARVGINDDAVSEQRTSKKVKRFAEAMGYAALGGVAVGAGLFSVLVATAPDFI